LLFWSQSGEAFSVQTEIRRAALNLEKLAIESLEEKIRRARAMLSKHLDEMDPQALTLPGLKEGSEGGVPFLVLDEEKEGVRVAMPAPMKPKKVWPLPDEPSDRQRFDTLLRELDEREFIRKNPPAAEEVVENMGRQFEDQAFKVRIALIRGAFFKRQDRVAEAVEDLLQIIDDIDGAAAPGSSELPFVLSALLLLDGAGAWEDPPLAGARDRVLQMILSGDLPLEISELLAVADRPGLWNGAQKRLLVQRARGLEVAHLLADSSSPAAKMIEEPEFVFAGHGRLWMGKSSQEGVRGCAYPAGLGLEALLDAHILVEKGSGLVLDLKESRTGAPGSGRITSAIRTLPAPAGLEGTVLEVHLVDPSAFEESVRTRRLFMVLAAIFMVLAMIAAGYATVRAVRREVAAAKARSDFMAAVSHELRTPLASIRMFAELIEGGRVKDFDKQGRFMRLIMSNCRRLSAMIENVLDLSRSDKGIIRFHLEEVDLKGLLEDLFHDLRIVAEEEGVAMEVKIDEALPSVRADPTALARAVFNVCDNARKYAGDDKHIHVQAEAVDGGAQIIIRDNGPGISEQDQQRIFERFSRGPQGEASAAAGLGLGLSLAREAIEGCQGRMELESKAGEGSTFTIFLPVWEEQDGDK
ncbi:MAG: sensor histidine kinase, partial [Planctomycetota bacterium]